MRIANAPHFLFSFVFVKMAEGAVYVSPEQLTPNELVSCLWSKDAAEKCRVGLTDTILFEKGVACHWYYTGRTGEILKKRNVDLNTVFARWQKIHSLYDPSGTHNTILDRNQTIAILKQEGNITKFLGIDALEVLISQNVVKPDPSILSLHCFVKGADKTSYRNKYTVKDSLGRFSTSTKSYVFKSRNNAQMPDAMQVYYDADVELTESKVVALRNIMDLATNTIVRYLEKMLNCRVLNIQVDYAIDQRSQLWMLWSNDIWVVRTTNLLSVTNWFKDSQVNNRMSWAGLKFQEEYKEMELDGRGSTVMSAAGATGSLTTATRSYGQHIDLSRIKTGEFAGNQGTHHNPIRPLEVQSSTLNVSNGAEQVYEAMSAVMDAKSSHTFKAKANMLQTHVMLPRDQESVVPVLNLNETRKADEESVTSVDTGAFIDRMQISAKEIIPPGPTSSNFPDARRCRGDYCQVVMHPVGPLFVDPEMKVHCTPIDHFFNKDELAKLQKQKQFNSIVKEHWQFKDKQLNHTHPIIMKSLVQARRERRGVFASNVNKDSWKNYPITPRHSTSLRQHLNELRSEGVLSYDDDSELSMEIKAMDMRGRKNADDENLEVLAGDKEYRDSFTKTLPQYYEEVRVCTTCYHIYQLLDWARECLWEEKTGKRAASKGKRKSKAAAALEQTNNGIVDGELGAENPEGVPAAVPYGRQTVPIPASQLPDVNRTLTSAEARNTRTPSRGNSKHGKRMKGVQSQSTPSIRVADPGDASSNKKKENVDRSGKVTWKDYAIGPDVGKGKNVKTVSLGGAGNEKFADLDDYLRGGAQALASKKAREKEQLFRSRLSKLSTGSATLEDPNNPGQMMSVEQLECVYRGRVLFACPNENPHAMNVIAYLEDAYFDVTWIKDGRQAVNDLLYRMDDQGFDCCLVDRNLPLDDAIAVTAAVRDHEREERKAIAAKMAARGKGGAPKSKRLPVICFTNETTPEDLKTYMKADMDGCVSFPVNKISLLDTIRAAIPHHLAEVVPKPAIVNPAAKVSDPLDELEEYENELKNAKFNSSKAFKMNSLGVLEGSTDSATMAAASMPVSAATEEDYSVNGVVQIDADTRIPFMVLDASKNAKVIVNPKKPFFNVVVCHDLFDTAEKMKIFFKPLIERYLGMQVLVWNYPGQAFTEFRKEQLLNNEYQAICLNELLGQVGAKGTKDFDTDKPFYLMGYGFGVSVASFYLAHFRVPNVRGLLSCNGWSYIDSYLAGVMHDCINVFQAAPPSRPDLPVYFFSRFLFCKDYLAKVSVPLALNIYTAVHNPISIAGRMALCKGVLQTVDMRSLLKEIDLPVICIQSTQDSFVRPLHVEPFVQYRNGEVNSIHSALQYVDKTCVIWVKSGHEMFQESKKQAQLLFEQILTGFHESHDITLPTPVEVDRVAVQQGLVTTITNKVGGKKNPRDMKLGNTVEDNYVNNILGTMNSVSSNNPRTPGGGTMGASSLPPLNNLNQSSVASTYAPGTASSINFENSMFDGTETREGSPSRKGKSKVVFNANDPNTWQQYSQTLSEGQIMGLNTNGSKSKASSKKVEEPMLRTFDPNLRAFERQDSVTYGKKDKTTNPSEYDEIKEYMGWRLKRNKKRLQRLQAATRIIQAAFRAYLARQFVKGIRRRKAASTIQRAFRGWIGRCSFLEQARRIWAAQRIQRSYRGYLGRKYYFFMRLRIAAAANIQRVYRGFHARCVVDAKRRRRYYAACKIQSLFRRNHARKQAFRRRYERNSAICIQRIFRGYLGKKKSLAERDKFIFSRSQNQGIEFGRQMLLEHKLHATKLQSDVTLLMQEKVAAEEMVEALLDEISSFEGGVRTLEKEMHQLSKVESEAAAYMDEESKYELREQKIRLDREFGDMLAKIANRKDMLTDLEKKLNTIDKTRQGKEEELRTLERKLVVLLEEQQTELNAIKRKQDIRGAMLAASHAELNNASAGTSNALVVASAPTGSVGGVAGNAAASGGGKVVLGGGGGGGSGPSLQEKKQAAQLMQSTETLMKFGFMSMSMTYFSSLNMIKALRTVSAQDTVMAALSDVHSQRAMGHGTDGGAEDGKSGKPMHLPNLKKGQLPGQEQLRVSAWSVDDVAKWLQTLSLGQYCEAFIDAAIDGEFLYDINDDDLKNTLGIEHRLHRKKILNCVHRLKVAEAMEDSRLNELLKETGAMEQAVSAKMLVFRVQFCLVTTIYSIFFV